MNLGGNLGVNLGGKTHNFATPSASTSSDPCFTNSRVDAHELLMARTKHTAKNSSEMRQLEL